MTADFCLRLGWAIGKMFTRRGNGQILIGKDTRVSGYMLESALESGLLSAGADVGLTGPMPTPAVAYLTRTLRTAAGIVISASHNPYHDNGIKVFDSNGNKLDDALEREIESQLNLEMTGAASDELGKAVRIDDVAGRYIEFCKATVPRGFRLQRLHVLLDCAHGATYHVAPGVLEELDARITLIGAPPTASTSIRSAAHPIRSNCRAKLTPMAPTWASPLTAMETGSSWWTTRGKSSMGTNCCT